MSEDAELERWEITTAVIGLRGAYRRGMDAYDRGLIPNQQIAGVSVAEFVFWACALDERLGKPDPMAYAKRRNADEHGQVLLGLRYVRDRHLHQVAITNSLEFAFEESSLRVWNRWRPLDAIPGPTGGHKRNRDLPAQRAAYKEHLEGRWPALAMDDALDFLTREVAARGIEVTRSSGIERSFATVETACLGKGESPGHAPGLSFAFCQEAGSIVPFLEKELADFDAEGGTIRFQPDHVIPDAVVRQIVRLRREQNKSKLKR